MTACPNSYAQDRAGIEDLMARGEGQCKFAYRSVRTAFLDGRESGAANPVLAMHAAAGAAG